jgi:RNA polymerase sigma-70 factor, ECF subfamily
MTDPKSDRKDQAPTLDKRILEQKSDEEMMELYVQGNEKAFEVIYARHSARVYGYLRKRLNDTESVNDCFQLTWMKFHHTRDKYNSSYPLVPWLFTICRSVLIDGLRKKKTVKETPDSLAIENVAAENTDSSKEAEFPDLEGLAEDQKRAIKMRYQDELSFEEMASKLEVSSVNARQIVSRAIRKLKALANGSGGKA